MGWPTCIQHQDYPRAGCEICMALKTPPAPEPDWWDAFMAKLREAYRGEVRS